MGGMQRADTLAPGKHEFVVETSVQNAVGRDLGGGEWMRWPYLAIGYRRGFTDRVEASVGASLLALRGGVKVRLNDPSDRDFAVSVAPEIGGAVFGEGASRNAILAAVVPVLVGWRIGQDGQLVVGPRVQYLRTYPAETSRVAPFELLAFGSSVGAVFPLTGWLAVVPEIAVLSPVQRDRFMLYGRVSPQVGGLNGVLVQVGLGFVFGDVAR